jgi:hypothetical protein
MTESNLIVFVKKQRDMKKYFLAYTIFCALDLLIMIIMGVYPYIDVLSLLVALITLIIHGFGIYFGYKDHSVTYLTLSKDFSLFHFAFYFIAFYSPIHVIHWFLSLCIMMISLRIRSEYMVIARSPTDE